MRNPFNRSPAPDAQPPEEDWGKIDPALLTPDQAVEQSLRRVDDLIERANASPPEAFVLPWENSEIERNATLVDRALGGLMLKNYARRYHERHLARSAGAANKATTAAVRTETREATRRRLEYFAPDIADGEPTHNRRQRQEGASNAYNRALDAQQTARGGRRSLFYRAAQSRVGRRLGMRPSTEPGKPIPSPKEQERAQYDRLSRFTDLRGRFTNEDLLEAQAAGDDDAYKRIQRDLIRADGVITQQDILRHKYGDRSPQDVVAERRRQAEAEKLAKYNRARRSSSEKRGSSEEETRLLQLIDNLAYDVAELDLPEAIAKNLSSKDLEVAARIKHRVDGIKRRRRIVPKEKLPTDEFNKISLEVRDNVFVEWLDSLDPDDNPEYADADFPSRVAQGLDLTLQMREASDKLKDLQDKKTRPATHRTRTPQQPTTGRPGSLYKRLHAIQNPPSDDEE